MGDGPAGGAATAATGEAEAVPAATFRRILLGLAGASVVGIALELASLRHWNGFDQLIPWICIAVVGVAVLVQWFRPSPLSVLAARVIGGTAAITGVYGVLQHVHSNYETAPLDFRYADTWATMSFTSKVWKAASGGVGPSPALAPLVLALAGLCLAFATVGLSGRPVRREA